MIVYKCDGCGKIIEREDVLYRVEITELVPDVGDWRKRERGRSLHFCADCYAAFSASVPVELKLEPWLPGEEG